MTDITKAVSIEIAANPISDYSWFDATSVLDQIRAWGLAQMVNPWSALAVVLARLSGDLHPSIVLPQLGSLPVGSLNTFVALAGESGTGKSALMSGVDEFMRRPVGEDMVRRIGPTTGEGLISVYVRHVKGKGFERLAYQGFAAVDEIGTLEAVAKRSGNTLLPTLRTLWSGASYVTSAAEEDRRRELPAHGYRYSMVVGVQPSNGLSLLGGDAQIDGTAQRFIFATVRDPNLTMESPFVDAPPPLMRDVHESIPFDPAFGTHTIAPTDVRRVLGVDDDVTFELRTEHKRIRIGIDGALDGHWLFTKLRVAALLAILHGECCVSRQWFDLADGVMRHSDATRQGLLSAIVEKQIKKNFEMGVAQGERNEAADTVVVRKGVRRIVEIVERHTHDRTHPEGGCDLKCLSLNLSNPVRHRRDEFIDEAESRGLVSRRQVGERGGTRVFLA